MDTTLEQAQQEIVDEFAMLGDWQDRYEQLIELGKELPLIAPEHKTDENLVRGCQSRVWLTAEPVSLLDCARSDTGSSGTTVIHFTADSDAMITKGLVALLVRVLNDRTPEEILGTPLTFIDRIGLREHLSPNRSNGVVAMLDQMKRYALVYSAKT
ncbi:MAG: SufE family protein [Flavobacteriales bacterium]|nr:SufE family protein [Flavobacteriales bacterium]MCB0758731.1 SufE family protein [Flavobacteriales bacterium]